jgi:hypothetical protein
VPELTVGGEDTVAQEGSPGLMKLRAFAELGKLAGEDGLDVLRLPRHEKADSAHEGDLYTIGTLRCRPAVQAVVVLEEPVIDLFPAGICKEAQAYKPSE